MKFNSFKSLFILLYNYIFTEEILSVLSPTKTFFWWPKKKLKVEKLEVAVMPTYLPSNTPKKKNI